MSILTYIEIEEYDLLTDEEFHYETLNNDEFYNDMSSFEPYSNYDINLLLKGEYL